MSDLTGFLLARIGKDHRMSRQRFWEYRLPAQPGAAQGDRLDELILAVESVLRPAQYGWGSANDNDGSCRYLIVANKTKARKLASALDARLGVTADIVEFTA